MHRLIDERYDSMIHCIRTGQPLRQAEKECYALSDPPFLFKGKKPHSITFPNGDRITVKSRQNCSGIATAIPNGTKH